MLFEQMLFVEPTELQNVMPWVIIAFAVIMLASILGKCVSIYRNLKKDKTRTKLSDADTQEKDKQNDENV